MNAQETAENLISEYGEEAFLKAALCGHKAIQSGDIEACTLWRDVMTILEQKQNPKTVIYKNNRNN